MNEVASKGLCAELEKLSGWSDTVWFHFRDRLWTSHEICGRTMTEDNRAIPTYTLGYLLRKLNVTGYVELRSHGNEQDRWTCTYEAHEDDGKTWFSEYADTMENAAAKLAIELFKQGVLKKEVA